MCLSLHERRKAASAFAQGRDSCAAGLAPG